MIFDQALDSICARRNLQRGYPMTPDARATFSAAPSVTPVSPRIVYFSGLRLCAIVNALTTCSGDTLNSLAVEGTPISWRNCLIDPQLDPCRSSPIIPPTPVL